VSISLHEFTTVRFTSVSSGENEKREADIEEFTMSRPPLQASKSDWFDRPSSTLLVPSTPLPPQVIFGGTPAWDPSSRTPRTPGSWYDRQETQQAGPSSVQLIKKPAGKVNRTGGYNLEESANLGDEYSEIKVCSNRSVYAASTTDFLLPRNMLKTWLQSIWTSNSPSASRLRNAKPRYWNRYIDFFNFDSHRLMICMHRRQASTPF
jgi:hypothetical protein